MPKFSETELTEKDYFNKMAGRYDENYRYDDPFTKYKIEKKAVEFFRLVRSRNKTKSIKMLEIGCGTGEYTKKVAKLFPESSIQGLDISDNIVRIAREKCKGLNNVSFVVKSAYDSGFEDESYDVVFGFYVLHHLNISKLRKEMYRVLRPGGLAFFYEPNILNPAVYLIKSNKYLKKKAGDSPNEWAINPLTIRKQLPGFKILDMATSEFVLPFGLFDIRQLITIDRITGFFKNVPFIKHLGGSVYIFLMKE